ncbi:MAG: hypothetical protein EBT09_04620 [Actinobacteria bacterium]|nr:hypothetical protein [Actinomycetota bacterium]
MAIGEAVTQADGWGAMGVDRDGPLVGADGDPVLAEGEGSGPMNNPTDATPRMRPTVSPTVYVNGMNSRQPTTPPMPPPRTARMRGKLGSRGAKPNPSIAPAIPQTRIRENSDAPDAVNTNWAIQPEIEPATRPAVIGPLSDAPRTERNLPR